jgi:hypothetical protein
MICCESIANWENRAYNDMLFLCEKYGTVPVADRYDPRKDLQVTGRTRHLILLSLDDSESSPEYGKGDVILIRL